MLSNWIVIWNMKQKSCDMKSICRKIILLYLLRKCRREGGRRTQPHNVVSDYHPLLKYLIHAMQLITDHFASKNIGCNQCNLSLSMNWIRACYSVTQALTIPTSADLGEKFKWKLRSHVTERFVGILVCTNSNCDTLIKLVNVHQ